MTTAARLPAFPDPAAAASCQPAIHDGVKALVLDFDGTLADTAASREEALRTALAAHGLDLDHDWYRRHVGLSIHDLLTALSKGRNLPTEAIIQHSRAQLLSGIPTITPVPCVLALLHAARRAGLPAAVASGASRLLVQPGLDALTLGREFAAVVTAEDVGHGKPAPDLFLAAAAAIGIPPNDCLAVDDAPEGTASARAAGMHVVTVVAGHLAPASADPDPAERLACCTADTASAPPRSRVPDDAAAPKGE